MDQAASEEFRRLAGAALKQGHDQEADHHLANALSLNAQDHAALAMRGEVRLQQKDRLEATFYYILAVNAHPQSSRYKERLLDLVAGTLAAGYDERCANALVACFRTAELDCTRAARFWQSLLLKEPRFDAAFGLPARQAFMPANKAFFESRSDFRPLFAPLFLEGIKRLTVYDALFEEFIVHIRRHLLGDFGIYRKFAREQFVSLASALSHYAFATDFILDETADERATVDTLLQSVEAGTADEAAIALLACYRPLATLKNARAILDRYKTGPLADVVDTQIAAALALHDTGVAIPSITQINGGVSAAVREQYESFPYPKWGSLSKDRALADWHNAIAHRNTEARLRGTSPSILIAGCGTGREAIQVATIFPDAKITALDLSRTSLAYAATKAEEHGIGNIAFLQGDILNLSALPEKFDYISSTGVLHHLENPIDGWRAYVNALKPGGLMRIGLYSERGREAVVAAREAIARRGYQSDREGMLRFRRDMPRLCSGESLRALSVFRDFYHLNSFRDLLFHVQEHRFDIPKIAAILDELKLSFEGFYLPNEVRAKYREHFPRDAEARDLSNWNAFERKYPETFRSMYIFWCRKGGSAA